MEHGGQEAVVVDDGPALDDIFKDEGVKATRVLEHGVCKDCPHMHPCMNSVWNEFRHGGPTPDSDSLEGLTSVHTCKTCTERVLEHFGQPVRHIVPEGCPRWGPVLGAAIDCGACEADRDALRKAHPRYEERVRAAGDLFREWIRTRAAGEEPPSVQPLARAMSEGIPDPEPATLIRAQRVLGHLIKDIRTRFQVPELDSAQTSMMMAEWLETLYFSLQRHPHDHTKVAHAFILVFNNRPPYSMAWAKTPPTTRRFIERTWGGLVSRGTRLPEG